MQTILAQRLKNITFELRSSEKTFYAKIQELHGNSSFRASNLTQGSNNSDNLLIEEDQSQVLEEEDT